MIARIKLIIRFLKKIILLININHEIKIKLKDKVIRCCKVNYIKKIFNKIKEYKSLTHLLDNLKDIKVYNNVMAMKNKIKVVLNPQIFIILITIIKIKKLSGSI